jgi:hypothetical protein
VSVGRRGLALGPVIAAGLVLVCCASAAGATAPYRPIASPLATPWTSQVDTRAPLPEYPRPTLQRTRWMSLNGQWQYEAGTAGEPIPVGRSLAQTILVPYPVQSPLSGIGREDASGWYLRQFVVPAGWSHDHVIVHFGAVSWRARVYVNGRLVGAHQGDYDSFSLDITRYLHRTGANELLVGFADPIGQAGEPVGKQVPGAPYSYFHTASSGIWQTVWLEPVARQHVDALTVTPRLDQDSVEISARVVGGAPTQLAATVLSHGHPVAGATGPTSRPLVLHIPHPVRWTPWDPYLYGLRLELTARGRVVDTATSYFGMRSITLGRVGGAVRILLNGRFTFQIGALDQGYWPDGLYTPPTDAAMRFDIVTAKHFGFDLLREHEKVQPDRWYYWADRLGLLVWQDMPSLPVAQRAAPTPAAQAEFRRELTRIVTQRRSHPSVAVWIPFNEGWGQFDPDGVTRLVRRLDPAALVDTDSGSADCCAAVESAASDIRDSHLYSGPFAVVGGARASVIGEFSGVLPFPPPGHRWPGTLTSVGAPVLAWDPPTVIPFLRAQYAELSQEMRVRGLSGAVVTEFANYEQEVGILTYDRELSTLPTKFLHGLNHDLIVGSQTAAGIRPQRARAIPGASGVWSFAEGQGSTAVDSRPRHQTLALTGGVGWSPGPRITGRSSTALAFTTAGQAARTAGPAIDITHSFTVSVWLKSQQLGESGSAVTEPGPDGSAFSLGIETAHPGQQSVPGLIAAHRSAVPTPTTYWTFMVPAGSDCTSLECGVRANLHYADERLSVRPGRWYQLTGVYDTLSQTIALYVDGVPEDVEHVFGVPPATGPLTVGQGDRDYTPTDAFIGDVAQLRIYPRALGPAEVWELYGSEVG